jgi:hypothetical protein
MAMEDIRSYRIEEEDRREDRDREELRDFSNDDEVPFEIPRD